jgi:hypothetical protein
VVFKNQARGTEDKRKKEFVNVSWEQRGNRVVLVLTITLLGPLAIGFPQTLHEVSRNILGLIKEWGAGG